jgi:hypothetical protein
MCEKVPNSDFDFSTFGQLFGIISHCETCRRRNERKQVYSWEGTSTGE